MLIITLAEETGANVIFTACTVCLFNIILREFCVLGKNSQVHTDFLHNIEVV